MFFVLYFPFKYSGHCLLNMMTSWNISIFQFLHTQNYRFDIF